VLELLNPAEAKEVWNVIDSPAKNTRIVKTSKVKRRRSRPRKVKKVASVTDPLLKGTKSASQKHAPKLIFGGTTNDPNLAANKKERACKVAKASNDEMSTNEKVDGELAAKPKLFKAEKKRSTRQIGLKLAQKMVNAAKSRRANEKYNFVITSSGKYSCVECPKVFVSKGTFVQHFDKHKGKSTCPLCERQFSRQRDMLVHLFTRHYSDQTKITSLKGPGNLCKICKVQINNNITHHIATWHLDWLTCPVCKEKFLSKHITLKHLLNMHALIKE